MKNLHTVLGATGATGKAIIEELQTRNLPIRGVGRSIQRTDIQTIKADLLDKEAAEEAIVGSAYVYLCVGLPYSTKVWQRDWIILMQNVIDACAKANAVLIFLDNIYMYHSPLPVPFDENVVQAPTSKKGQARKAIADLMLKAMQEGKIKGVIGRAADFFGKASNVNVLYISFLERILQGKAPQWLGQPNKKHTYSTVSDIGRALVALALNESTYGQVWHIPVGEPITIEEMMVIINL